MPQPIGAPEGQTTGNPGETQQTTGNAGKDEKGPIPYERFEEVIRQNQQLKQAQQEQAEKLKLLSQPQENLQALEAKKRDEIDYWKNPYEYERRKDQDRARALSDSQARQQEQLNFSTTLVQLQSSPEYSKELETKMSNYATEYGLGRMIDGATGLPDRASMVKASFEAVTGRKFGEWQANNYRTTQQLKERLTRPGSTGSVKDPMMSPEEFNKIPAEEYEKNPQKYNEQLQTYMQSLNQ